MGTLLHSRSSIEANYDLPGLGYGRSRSVSARGPVGLCVVLVLCMNDMMNQKIQCSPLILQWWGSFATAHRTITQLSNLKRG